MLEIICLVILKMMVWFLLVLFFQKYKKIQIKYVINWILYDGLFGGRSIQGMIICWYFYYIADVYIVSV